MATHTAPSLREVLGVRGFQDSEIDDSEERDSLVAAVQSGDVHRETHAGEHEGQVEDFLRVIGYQVPGTDLVRFAVHRVQGDGLAYIHDSDDRGAVEAAYEGAVRDLSDCGPDGGPYWAVTDVSGVATEQPADLFDLEDDEDDDF